MNSAAQAPLEVVRLDFTTSLMALSLTPPGPHASKLTPEAEGWCLAVGPLRAPAQNCWVGPP